MHVNMTNIIFNIMQEVEEEMAVQEAETQRVRNFEGSGPLLMPKQDIGPLLLPKNNGGAAGSKINISI